MSVNLSKLTHKICLSGSVDVKYSECGLICYHNFDLSQKLAFFPSTF